MEYLCGSTGPAQVGTPGVCASGVLWLLGAGADGVAVRQTMLVCPGANSASYCEKSATIR